MRCALSKCWAAANCVLTLPRLPLARRCGWTSGRRSPRCRCCRTWGRRRWTQSSPACRWEKGPAAVCLCSLLPLRTEVIDAPTVSLKLHTANSVFRAVHRIAMLFYWSPVVKIRPKVILNAPVSWCAPSIPAGPVRAPELAAGRPLARGHAGGGGAAAGGVQGH